VQQLLQQLALAGGGSPLMALFEAADVLSGQLGAELVA
jgi:hypothetical protein